LDGHEHVAGHHADLEVREAQAIQVLGLAQSRLHQRLWRRLAVLLLQVLLQRTGVDPDADRDALVAGGLDHRLHAVLAADIAGVDAQAVDTQLGHAQGDLVVEVDVGDQRHAHLLLDPAEGLRGLHGRYRDAHDVGAGVFQATDLADGGLDVTGLGVGHALHGDRRIAADRYRADPDLAGGATLDGGFAMHVQAHCPSLRRAVSPWVEEATSTGWPLTSTTAPRA